MPISSPTAFDVKCGCGKEYHTSDEHIGKYVNCGCGRRVPIQHPAAIERHSAVDDPKPSPPATPRAPNPAATGASKLETLSRFIFCVSAFLAFALLLSKLLLLAARHWSMYLPSRRILHANLNAALLVAVGFATASGLVCFWAGHKGTIAGSVSKRVRSVRLLLGKGKSALHRIPFQRKVISALVLCCALAIAVFWTSHSRRAAQPARETDDTWVVESEKPSQQSQPQGSASAAAPAVRWDDEAGKATPAPGAVPEGYILDAAPAKRAPGESLKVYTLKATDPPIDRSHWPAGFTESISPSLAIPRKRTARAQAIDQRPTTYNSLPTGTRITPDIGTNGHGTLTVTNGTTEDAVVRLYDVSSLQTLRWFFVQAGGSAQMGQLPEGTYTLAYTRGLDWLESRDVFRWHPHYNQFGKQLEYTEQHDPDGVHYQSDDIRVTLNPVIGGNVRTRVITREEFLKGHHHMPLQR